MALHSFEHTESATILPFSVRISRGNWYSSPISVSLEQTEHFIGSPVEVVLLYQYASRIVPVGRYVSLVAYALVVHRP